MLSFSCPQGSDRYRFTEEILHFKSSSAKASAQTSFARALPGKIVRKPHLHARFLEKSSATADSHLPAAKLICKPIFVTCSLEF
jgi:hypothetical protein